MIVAKVGFFGLYLICWGMIYIVTSGLMKWILPDVSPFPPQQFWAINFDEFLAVCLLFTAIFGSLWGGLSLGLLWLLQAAKLNKTLIMKAVILLNILIALYIFWFVVQMALVNGGGGGQILDNKALFRMVFYYATPYMMATVVSGILLAKNWFKSQAQEKPPIKDTEDNEKGSSQL